MSKYLIPLMAGALLLTGVVHAIPKSPSATEKFYGKIVGIDQDSRSFTVHNKRKNQDATFRWDDETGITSQKNPIQPAELKVGQLLVISYVSDAGGYKAKRITVRPTPFRKKDPKNLFQ